MASFNNMMVNPWVLHLQKLALELKCPLCLELLNRPVLLPCDHVFCDSCIHESSQIDSSCLICKSKYSEKALRNLQFMESVISIYKSLNAAVSVHLPQVRNQDCESPKDGSEDSEMIDKDVIKRSGRGRNSSSGDGSPLSTSKESNPRPKHPDWTAQQLLDHLPLYELESENDAGNQQVPEGYAGQAAKRKCNIIASQGSKRQKNLMQKVADVDFNDNSSANSDDQLAGKSPKASNLIPPVISDRSSSNITICGFCQSAKVSEATGEMLHYSKGRPVVGDDIFSSNVIHVHSACIEWAPQVYYEGDTVKNLKPELARGMKIKCTKCGLKGAALGCFVKSCRRSYHVPCARETSKCRWDHEDFLLLCPTHSSVKFPNEKSRHSISRAEPLPKTKPAVLCNLENKPATKKELVLCGSALSQSDKRLMDRLAIKLNATISRYWNPSVTHVIASTDEKGACTRTLKVLMGILNGKWIINADWMKASLEASQHVDEEPFEIHLDTQGCQDGPKTARIRAATNQPKLFEGLRFYFYGDFIKGYKEDLQNLVKVAGGTILNTEDELNESNDKEEAIVVYNIDPPHGCGLGEEVTIIWRRGNEAEALASKTGSRVVGHTWLLESIAGYKLHPVIT
ncbi:unnamed protein product [Cochlearia groenlandica]